MLQSQATLYLTASIWHLTVYFRSCINVSFLVEDANLLYIVYGYNLRPSFPIVNLHCNYWASFNYNIYKISDLHLPDLGTARINRHLFKITYWYSLSFMYLIGQFLFKRRFVFSVSTIHLSIFISFVSALWTFLEQLWSFERLGNCPLSPLKPNVEWHHIFVFSINFCSTPTASSTNLVICHLTNITQKLTLDCQTQEKINYKQKWFSIVKCLAHYTQYMHMIRKHVLFSTF